MINIAQLNRTIATYPQIYNAAYVINDNILPSSPTWLELSNIAGFAQYHLSSTGIVSGLYVSITQQNGNNIITVTEGVYKDWAAAFWFASTSTQVSLASITQEAYSNNVGLPATMYLYYSFTYAQCSGTNVNPVYLVVSALPLTTNPNVVEYALIAYLNADNQGNLSVNYNATQSLIL